MKLTKQTLKQIIKEELEATMEEGFFSDVFGGGDKKRGFIGDGREVLAGPIARELGHKHADEGQPEKSIGEIVAAAEEFCREKRCSVNERDFIDAYQKAYSEAIGWRNDQEERRASSESDYDPDYHPDDDYDYESYRQAMSKEMSGGWTGARGSLTGHNYRKGSPRTRGRS